MNRHPQITDEQIRAAKKELEVTLKIMRILGRVRPAKRFAVLQSAVLFVEAEHDAAEPA